MTKSIWFWLHVLFFVLVVVLIFFVDWYYILAIFLALRLQDLILGGCILTKLEFGSYERRFDRHYYIKYLPKFLKKSPTFFVDWILPMVLVFITFLIHR